MIKIGPDDEMKKLYNTPVNKRLKYCALGAIMTSIALPVSIIILFDDLSHKAMMLMRGFSGVGAIVLVILYACLLYRVNREYINRK